MKTPILFALALMLSSSLLAQELATSEETPDKATAVPATIDFQGRLYDSGGSPVNATLSIKFSLYDIGSGGTALWTETKSVQVTDGLFQVKLGEVTPFSQTHFSGADRWLGIKVGTEAEMSPRTKISSVGYAMQALETDPTWQGNAAATGPVGRMGRVGIGVDVPEFDLHVVGAPSPDNYGVVTVEGIKESGYTGAEFRARINGNFAASFGSDSNEDYLFGFRNDKPLKIYTSQTERMRISPEGNVGIGTIEPLSRLHVKGAVDNPANFGVILVEGYLEGGYTGAELGTRVNGVLGVSFGSDTYEDYIYGWRSDKPLKLYTNQLERLRITPTGYVGIGTTNPGAMLEVAGQIRITGGGPGLGKVLTSDAGGLASWQEIPPSGLNLPFEGSALTTEIGSAAFKVSNPGTNQVVAITGHATATDNVAMGIYGRSDAYDGRGIYGVATHQTGFTYGVVGSAQSSNRAYGVYGTASSASGITYGVYGGSASSEGTGVYGTATSATGNTFGVFGYSSSNYGTGIYGYSVSPSGPTYGVYGKTESSGGHAVMGYATSSSGTTYGVASFVNSPSGYSGYFNGGRFFVDGNVGINAYNPTVNLDIAESGIPQIRLSKTAGTAHTQKITFWKGSTEKFAIGFDLWGDGSNLFTLYDTPNSSPVLNIINTRVGIGTTSPTQKLDVNGTVRIRGTTSGTVFTGVYADSNGNLILSTSDARLKENILPLQNSLEKVMELQGVSFSWKEAPGMGRHFGFIAQEFEQVIPELVITNQNDGYKGINYEEITALLVESTKEQQEIIKSLKAENEQLNARLERLERALEGLVEK
ncbi:MAG: tail fiber domain-containing protein [Bacteroides sp.]|jgi:hypothetical protein|nr:tail fiber domain-containing protein [Bacteroides sp.]